MKYINKIIALTLLLFVGVSCVGLDEDTSSILTIDNLGSEADVIAALTPVYRQTSESYKEFHEQRSATYGADDLTTWWGGNKAPLRVFDGFDYGSGENSDINWLDHGWNSYWKTIYYANTVVEGLKTATAPEDIVKIGDAEARYLRSLAYFHLVRTHGNMPIILDGYVPTGDEERATVLANYQHIEADLLIAEANLPGPGSVSPGRVSAAAAKTLLADLYLTWGGWPVKDNSKYGMAATKSKEIIDTWAGDFRLLPIEDLWLLENENSQEAVFSVQFSQAANMNSTHAASTSFHESRGWSDAFPELQFFYDFPEGARKDATFRTEIPQRGFTAGAIFTKNPPTVHYTVSQRFHPMYKKFNIGEDLTVGGRTTSFRSMEAYRYAEVLLMYAEAQVRAGGQTAESIEALNQVRRRAAGLPYMTPDITVDLTTATVDEIIAERGWEFAGEYKRWFDLVRSEKLEEIAAQRDPTENVPLLRQPTKAQYIAPIPFAAIMSSKLVQNPEGFKIK
jgi:hypothetical protein